MNCCIVTGSTGFLGAHLVPALVSAGHRVLAMVRRSVRADSELIVPVCASLEDVSPLRRAIEVHGCDYAFHFAAAIPAVGTPLSFESAASTNVTGTARLLDVLQESGARAVIYASSIAVYSPSTALLHEQSQTVPADPYAISKLCGELYCDAWASRTGARAVSLRIASPYGAGMNMRTLLPHFLQTALSGQVPQYYGCGDRTQEFVHASDVVSACLQALERGRGPYNIGGESASARELAQLALDVCERSDTKAQAAGKPDPQDGRIYRMDCSRAAAELGYHPRYTLREGMNDLRATLLRPGARWWREG